MTNWFQIRKELARRRLRRWLTHLSAAAAVLLIAAPAPAAIQGTVVNATTGEPASRVAVTLVRFGGSQGMAPVDEVYTDEQGRFRFDEETLGPDSQAVHGMLRAEYDGISYSKMIVPDTPLDNLRVDVYSAVETETLKPEMTALLFEPDGARLVVNQFFQFSNTADPPKTFRDPDNGTLQFYLPPAAQGQVQVQGTGPAGMPLPSSAVTTSRENVYMVDFPLKPGDNLIELTYSLPFSEGESFDGRILYDGVETRFVAPEGVTIEAENLNSIGQEPRSGASIYEYTGGADFSVAIRGEGRLSRAGGEGAPSGGGGGEITIAPAPVAKELIWVIGITAAILALGFYNLLSSKAPKSAPPPAPATDGSQSPKASVGSQSTKARRRKR